MKVAVTGALGFVGRELTRELSARGHTVRGLIHRHRPAREVDDVEYVTGDVHDAASLDKAFEGVDAVFHLVGIIAETRLLSFEKTVIEGTTNVVSACRRAGVKHIVYLSALGADDNSEIAYFHSKGKAEDIIKRSGVNFTIMRASVIYGPGDKFINMIMNMITRLPVIPVIGNGEYLLQPVYLGDIAEVMAASLENPEARDKIFDIGGPEQISYKSLINILKRHLNKKRINIYLPMWLMQATATILEKFMKPAPVTKDQLKMLAAGSVADNSELLRRFRIELTGLEKGLKLYMR